MADLGKQEERKQGDQNTTPVIRWEARPWVEWIPGVNAWRNGIRRPVSGSRRMLLFLAVVGPGVITSNVDNDAGGISVYSQAGAMYGYALLWSLIPMTIALYVTEEMCARMGVVTGKGLSDLIRQEFGFRSTFSSSSQGSLWIWATSRKRNSRASRRPCRFSACRNIFPCRLLPLPSGSWSCAARLAR